MIPSFRKAFNKAFTKEKYEEFLKELESAHPGEIEFRVAETPVFVPKSFTNKILDACENIIDLITDPRFIELTDKAIPPGLKVPGEIKHTQFIAFDFGICVNDSGEYEPQLIEMQGFPSLFAYEVLLDDVFRKHFDVPDNFSCYLNGYDRESYIRFMKEIIVAGHNPENVILLEIFPRQQKTRIDFYCTEEYLGIKMVCLTELIKEGKNIYYIDNGRKIQVKRIYNRVIFDDLQQQTKEVQEKGKIFFEELEVEWCPHPDWFYRISKFTLPLIRHPYVPQTFYLNQVKQIPTDLENYVLKPLFSFAGQGVVIDVTEKDILDIKDPENWILQRKVKYADVIETPDVPAKAEIRMFYFWKEGDARPVAVNNLGRLSKGKMIGVRYNKDKEWVGGCYCLFEK
ncbi:MAG TPA: hypothetical protein PKC72_17215 [Chitinophagaceae bacterium]|mgnify:CR=1 FL=1|nr:hypothetical protein [Chitinophagaceae bacterium]